MEKISLTFIQRLAVGIGCLHCKLIEQVVGAELLQAVVVGVAAIGTNTVITVPIAVLATHVAGHHCRTGWARSYTGGQLIGRVAGEVWVSVNRLE